MGRVRRFGLLLSGVLIVTSSIASESILVQSTTSTANSGLYDHLLPVFEEQFGVRVNVVAVGTGQAIRNAQNCDGDVLLVHAKQAEEEFVRDGYGLARYDLMYNDFVIVGPPEDPARVGDSKNIELALNQIATNEVLFTSRGDDSGTHKKELALWKSAGIDPESASGTWYRETGSGMGATLTAAIGMNAYSMTDRATWISFKNKNTHKILLSGDSGLFNQYGVMIVNPENCPNVKLHGAEKFVHWLLSASGQSHIAQHKVDHQQLFFPNAKTSQ